MVRRFMTGSVSYAFSGCSCIPVPKGNSLFTIQTGGMTAMVLFFYFNIGIVQKL